MARSTEILFMSLMTWLLITESVGQFDDQTVVIQNLSVPRFPKAGEDVVLTCKFALGGRTHRLYTVNWWRGKEQFYTYKKNSFQPKNAYSFPGIHVEVDESTEEKIVLKNVSEDTSGVYKCEVMGEGPAFRTAVETMEMKVIVPPERLELRNLIERGPYYRYQKDDLIHLNCTAYRVKPRPILTWTINGQKVSRNELIRYPVMEDQRGRVTSTLALRFMAPRYFENRLARATCTVYVEGHEFTRFEDLQLDPSAAFDLYSSGGWKRSVTWQMLCILFVMERTWNL